MLEDLIGVLQLQARELEKLVVHVEQVAGRLGYQPKFSVVAAELTALHMRLQKAAPRERHE